MATARRRTAGAPAPTRLDLFYKDARGDIAELLIEKLGRIGGTAVADLLSDGAKQRIVDLLGGSDGNISEFQVNAIAAFVKIVLPGSLSEEGAQSFIKSFGESMREYASNPIADRASRRSFFGGVIDKAFGSFEVAPVNSSAKTNLSDAINELTATDRRAMRDFMLASFGRGGSMLDLNTGMFVQVTYAELIKHGEERLITKASLRGVLDYIEMNRNDLAFTELARVVKAAPLINPPKPVKKPEQPTWLDGIRKEAVDEMKKFIEPTKPGDPLGEPFASLEAFGNRAKASLAKSKKP